jgi:hypothetical protein
MLIMCGAIPSLHYMPSWHVCLISETTLCSVKYFKISEVWDFMQLWARWSRDGIPVEERFPAPVQTGPGAPSSLQYNGYWVFPRDKAVGVLALTTHIHLAPRLKKE